MRATRSSSLETTGPGDRLYRGCGYTIWHISNGVRIEKESVGGVELVVYGWVPMFPALFGLLVASIAFLLLATTQWNSASAGALVLTVIVASSLLIIGFCFVRFVPLHFARSLYSWSMDFVHEAMGAIRVRTRIGWFRTTRELEPTLRLLVRPTGGNGDWGFEHRLFGSNRSVLLTIGPRMGFRTAKTSQKHAQRIADAMASELHCQVEYRRWQRYGGKDWVDDSHV